ncbi:MAG: hypothetical protein Q7T20_01435 [Saprospiraceae bacterium]|nr:hypothetical protein [Saprospiraceae bacterium]
MHFRLYRSLFIVLLFCEILLLTSQRMRYMAHRENALVMIFITIAMGVLAMLAAFRKSEHRIEEQYGGWESRLMKIVALIAVPLCAFHFYREISVIPIAVQISDIVPTIQVMNDRILNGQYAYNIIRDFGYDLSPTYLPLMWLPFLPAAIFHFDERWVAFVIWAIAALLVVRRAQLGKLSTEAKWLLTALPFFYFILIEESTDATYGNTIELMIAGFYMLFALQLDKIREYLAGDPRKKGALLAFFIILCLLSRYSFLLWLPFFFLIVWVENRKLALSTTAWAFLYVMLIYVFPFMIKDPSIYLNGIKHYSEGALLVWLQPEKVGPLYEGLGMANIFRDELGGEMAQRLSALQRWQVLTSLTATGLCTWIWWKKRAQIQHLSLFLLGSLKFYFAFFYGFIQMPYIYLMLTPCFLSIVILLSFYREQEQQV